ARAHDRQSLGSSRGLAMSGARQPLRVLLTRSEEDCADWAAELEHRGIAAVALPCLSAEPIDSPALRAALQEAAARADWLVFTSKRGVEAYARLTGGEDEADAESAEIPGRHAKPSDAARPTSVTKAPARPVEIAVVGAATAETARRRLGRADLVGPGTAHSLAERLIEELGRRQEDGLQEAGRLHSDAPAPHIVLALAENAGDTLERALEAAGCECRRFDVYRTVPAAPRSAKRSLASLEVDAVLLASPSAATGLVNQVQLDQGARLVTIGPSTSRAVRELGLDIAGEAREQSLAGLLEALENTYV
ncbi:MAG TPA: uroporphyrinogen-III synthase, partial [Gammaproteobacteria bacterium]|nr:uroporphyrinogen-III synthase [Gammaproteobacteria bacterium]